MICTAKMTTRVSCAASHRKMDAAGLSRIRFAVFCLLLLALVALLFVLSLCLGAVRIPLAELAAAFSGSGGSASKILRFVRIPRALSAMLCGAALAASGAIVQSVLHNPLGSPNVLGMNAGAGLCVMVCAALAPFAPQMLPFAAFTGALATLVLVCALGHCAGGSRVSVLLSGVAVGAFLTALSDGITVLLPDTIYTRTAFRIGSLSGVQLRTLALPAVVILLALVAAGILRHEIDVLALGDECAQSLGLSVGAVRGAALVIAAMLCGAGISVAGLVGFVGLIVPHCARRCVGSAMGRLLPASVLLGAALVLLCDLVSRLLFAPYELPVGIALSLVGGVFFVALLLRERGAIHD